MKEHNDNENKKRRMGGEKKFYLFTALGCAAVLMAIIVVAIAVTNNKGLEDEGMRNPSHSSSSSVLDEESGDGNSTEEESSHKPVDSEQEDMILPVASGTLLHDYGFYHNQTLNTYYGHEGLDFAAEVGAEVLAAADGVVESIYKDDLLLGTEIVVAHADGLKTVYRFVEEMEGLNVGDEVEQGEVIATVAEPTGNEYKDGAHLHFEVLENGVNVDPTDHLTLEEK